MRLDIAKITSAVNKVSALTSDIKAVPGILLNIVKEEDGSGKMDVCFHDGHKAVIETIDVELEDTDYVGSIVVGYDQFSRAISSSQPTGMIKIPDFKIEFKEGGNVLTVVANQAAANYDNEGNIVYYRPMASKKMDVAWVLPNADMKVSILSRIKYDNIFDAKDAEGMSIDVDTLDKAEFVDALARTSVEKGKQIYLSTKTQTVFVANQAHVTSVPIEGYELTEDMKTEIAGTLSENNCYSEENFAEACRKASNRFHYPVSMSQTIAKSVLDILNKTSADTIYMYTKDKCCNIYVETENEKVGIWFEMAVASKTHVGTLERYNALGYKTYQLMFIKEFLVDIIKTASNVTKSDKIEISFEKNNLGGSAPALDLIVKAGSASNSTSDVYKLTPDSLKDTVGDLESKTFKISLKVLSDMLAQIKTLRTAFDLNVGTDGSVCIRISEIHEDRMKETYAAMREEAKKVIEAAGQVFDINSTPTPDSVRERFDMRDPKILVTKQYTMLGN